MEYKLYTTTAGDKIVQRLDYVCGDIVDTIFRQIIDTGDEEVRRALIKLGWTPPPKGEENVER